MKQTRSYILFAFILLSFSMPLVALAQQRYRIAVCDWMILKRQKLGEFALAKTLGADGIELDMGGLGVRDSFDNKLRQPYLKKIFKRAADSLSVEVPSVAMSGLYAQSFAKHKNYKYLVEDCLNTMEVMGAKVAFLPLGGCINGWESQPEVREALVKRLREVGNMAAARGMVIGIDTPLDAKGNIKLLDEINSQGIKIFYKFQTALDNKRNLCSDLKRLGKNRICMIHCTNTDGYTLADDPAIDMKKVKKTLDGMKWSGWLVIERSRDVKEVHNVKKNYGSNVSYLKQIFQKN
jgi:sugar phosphate isomerase/epimerase